MAVSLNRVVLTGNLTRDPELRSLPSGMSVCELAIAVNGREKKGGEWGDRVDYFDVVVWGTQGENAARYLTKGRAVAIDGKLRLERWTNKDGANRSKVTITADNVQFLPDGRRDADGRPPAQAPGADSYAQSYGGQAPGGQYATPAASAADDDIPF